MTKMLSSLRLLIVFASVGSYAQQCSVPGPERLGCFGWWKWDTDEFCVERGCCMEKGDSADWCFYNSPKAKITEVHVIQGCHLDVGFANTAVDIVNLWFNEHLPRAAAVGAELQRRNGTAQLHFTAPAWIVSLYLDCPPELPIQCPNASARADVFNAIFNGWITWYAFPFNGMITIPAPLMQQWRWNSWIRR
jgi:hypothetical protein